MDHKLKQSILVVNFLFGLRVNEIPTYFSLISLFLFGIVLFPVLHRGRNACMSIIHLLYFVTLQTVKHTISFFTVLQYKLPFYFLYPSRSLQ
jgi:hypothetical protein